MTLASESNCSFVLCLVSLEEVENGDGRIWWCINHSYAYEGVERRWTDSVVSPDLQHQDLEKDPIARAGPEHVKRKSSSNFLRAWHSQRLLPHFFLWTEALCSRLTSRLWTHKHGIIPIV